MFESIFKRKEDEEKFKKEGRLPPGQAYSQRFPVLHYGPVPAFNQATWDFKVWGEVEEPLHLTWDEFNKLPRSHITMDIHCVTRWSKFDTLWEGVHLQTLLDKGFLKITPKAHFVVEHAEYGYTTNIPLAVALQPNFMMATHFNGEPLSPDHGYPLRGVIGAIPGRNDLTTPYLWKGAKWLRGLEFLNQDQLGFWELGGYNNSADVWKEERFA